MKRLIQIIICSITIVAFSQTKVETEKKIAIMETMAANAKLNDSQISKLKDLIIERAESLEKYKNDMALQDSTSIIYVANSALSKESIERKFFEGLNLIMNEKQFKDFFAKQIVNTSTSQLEARIKKVKQYYTLTKEGQVYLEKTIKPYFEELAFYKLYYQYDHNLAIQKSSAIKLDLEAKYAETIKTLGFNPIEELIVSSPKVLAFEQKALKIGLDNNAIQKVKELVAIKQKKQLEHDWTWSKLEGESVFHFYDVFTSKENIQKEFVKNLQEVITYEQFKALFASELTDQISREHRQKIAAIENEYDLSKDHMDQISEVLYYNAVEEIITDEYNKYDYQIAYQKRQEVLKNQSIPKLESKLKELGYSTKESSTNQKVDRFIATARKAKIPESKIKAVLKYVEDFQTKEAARGAKWVADNQKYLLEFYFEYDSREGLKKIMRNGIREILTLEEFTKLFSEQLMPHVEILTKDFMEKETKKYSFEPKQFKEIKKLVRSRYLKEVFTQQYYDYDYERRDRKVRVITYAFQKEYRKKMESYDLDQASKTTDKGVKGFDWN